LDPSRLNRAVGALLHEVMHKIEAKSNLRILTKEVYSSLIQPLKLDIGNYKWKYLLVESILKSIASTRSNTYFGRILWGNILEEDLIFEKDLPFNKVHFEYLIRVVALAIEPLTQEYVQNFKPLDKTFVEKVSLEWIGLLTKNQS
jgi:hypothetical protein